MKGVGIYSRRSFSCIPSLLHVPRRVLLRYSHYGIVHEGCKLSASIQYTDLFSRGEKWGRGGRGGSEYYKYSWWKCLWKKYLLDTQVLWLKDMVLYTNLLALLVEAFELDSLGVVKSFSIDQMCWIYPLSEGEGGGSGIYNFKISPLWCGYRWSAPSHLGTSGIEQGVMWLFHLSIIYVNHLVLMSNYDAAP